MFAVFITGFLVGVVMWLVGRDLEKHDEKRREKQYLKLKKWLDEDTSRRLADIQVRYERAMNPDHQR